MSSQVKTGCNGRYKFGWIASGYSPEEDFWYSSEGIFNKASEAKKDLLTYYDVDIKTVRTHRIPLV
jgi:hypothetical protein